MGSHRHPAAFGIPGGNRLRHRPVEKAIPILIGDSADLEKVAISIPETVRKLASSFWPGPLTLVVYKKPTLPVSVSRTSTIGVRMPNHEVARALLRAAGPMAVTFANISGQENPVTAQEVYDQLGGRILLIIDGGKTPEGVPSTIVDCTTQELKILRAGRSPRAPSHWTR